MCYNVATDTLEEIRYALHRGDYHLAEELERKLADRELLKILNAERKPLYFVSGYDHPRLRTYTNREPMKARFLSWGLIPPNAYSEAHAKKIRNSTLNAKAETMFTLESFRDSALNRRCLIYIDAFYEHHDQGGKKYPCRISAANGEPLALGGLWSEWYHKESGRTLATVAIVTTEANALMSQSHPQQTEEFRNTAHAGDPAEGETG
jgi:putative SOS response-associated peptidase YedK